MPEGVVFDLGYRPHEGHRLGRAGAIRALFRDGIRRVFGLRRKARRKILPAVLIGIAVLPALFFVAIGVVAGELDPGATFFDHADYFDLTGAISLVFIALAASELIVPDRIYGTMSVYASRPLTILDYLGARAGSLAAVVFGFIWLPHVVLFIGRAWVDEEGFGTYVAENLDNLWQTGLASLVYIVAYGSLAFLVAVFSTRTTLAVFVFLVVVPISGPTTGALVDSGTSIVGLAALQHHPGYVMNWIMNDDTHRWIPERAGYEPIVSLVVIGVIAVVATIAAVRRYRRLV
jgi:ABC-2 type transport system permease protein